MRLRPLQPCALALLLLAVLVLPANAQDEKGRPAIPSEGPEVFAYLLKMRGYAAVPTIADLDQQPRQDTLLVLFGRLDWLRPQDLRQFQLDGGNILLASDYALNLPDYGVRIAGEVVREHDDPLYQETPECPLVKALEPGAPTPFRRLAKGLATNRPSYFTQINVAGRPAVRLQPLIGFREPGGRAIARPFGGGKTKAPRQGLVRSGKHFILPHAYLADKDADVAGRALLLAGNGCFTNQMLLQRDNDNFAFASECLAWLGQRPDGTPRRHVLFVVDGHVIDSSNAGLTPPPMPVPPIPRPSIAVVNELMHGIEKEGLLVRMLEDNVDVRVAVRCGLILLTLLLLCYGAKKLIEQRHHTERGSALLAGPYALPPDTSPLAAQKARSQIERSALGAEAQALVRAWFLETCAIPVAEWNRTTAVPTRDALVTGSWWTRLRMRRQIDRLARLAGPTIPTSFSWTDLVRLTKTLHALRAQVQQGRLRLAGCSAGEKP